MSFMAEKQVVVREDNTKLQITVGPPYGLAHVVSIDLTNSKSIVEGVIQVLALSDAHMNDRISALAQKVDVLEKRVLNDDDIRRLIYLLKTQSTEFRPDGRPTNDDILASKLDAMLRN
jgi:hypothetical protein